MQDFYEDILHFLSSRRQDSNCDLCVPNAALYQTEPRLDMIRLEANESYNNTFWQNLQVENERKIKVEPVERKLPGKSSVLPVITGVTGYFF